jgi:SAM-dependent methyltransferase
VPDRFFTDSYLAGIYDAWHSREERKDFDFYLPRIREAKAVLDVGCGTGSLLHEARDAGYTGRLCGIDPARGMLQRARKRSDIEWIEGDLQSAGWEEQFDLIVMAGHAFQVFLGDDELRSFIAAVYRALVPGGIFAFETRNPLAREWEHWTGDDACVGPDGTPVRIRTEVTKPFDGRTVTFTITFRGEHPSLPQVSESTLRFLDADQVRELVEGAGLRIDRQLGDFGGGPLTAKSPEIITLAMR